MNGRRTVQWLVILGAFAALACGRSGIEVLPWGTAQIQVQLKLPLQYASYDFTWAGTNLGDGTTMPGGLESSATASQLNARGGFHALPVSPPLYPGTWQFGIKVLGDGQLVLATTCNQQIYWDRQAILKFTEGGTGCVCLFGCSPP